MAGSVRMDETVWWDPAVLELDVAEEASLRQQRILESDKDGVAAAASEENYARWKLGRDEVLVRASHPSILVQTVTSLARGLTDSTAGIQLKWRLGPWTSVPLVGGLVP